MIYKDFHGDKLSELALGCMRLPVLGGDDNKIDQAQVEEMVAVAIEGGVNYFDTAYGYHGGNSEAAIGRALAAYPRESFYLADKFPGYNPANIRKDKLQPLFEEQLTRCRVDHFDFYLLHNVCEPNIDLYLDPAIGVLPFFKEQLAAGRIRHLGFSAHAGLEGLARFLEAFGPEMEFGQLQLNYVDWDFQKGADKVRLFERYDIPLWVMEPLRGGQLASLEAADAAELEALRPGVSAAEWAFRYAQSLPAVTTVLSGMSNLEQLKDNLRIFASEAPVTAEERATLQKIAQTMVAKTTIDCTACRYCVDYCSEGLDIPRLLALYNEQSFTTGVRFIAPMAISALPEDKRPSACIACHNCEEVCPQQLPIAQAMADFSKMLEESED
ncbi:MAG: aldo/keto reductase [Coriobacteriales bacterium]|nr:aldo/keto reductase [Coriobacteriales bacterium]